MMTDALRENLRELEWLSIRISDLIRATALGLIVVSWGFLIAPQERLAVATMPLATVIVLGLVALLADWLQYVTGYLNAMRSYGDLLENPAVTGYARDRYRTLRVWLFGVKQAVTILAVIVFLAGLVPAMARVL